MKGWLRTHSNQLAFLVFSVGAVAVAYWLIVLTGRVNQQEAVRKSNAESQYAQCIASIPLLGKINDKFRSDEAVWRVALQNSRDTHKITPKGTALYRQQAANITNLHVALKRGGVRVPVPTRAACDERRERALRG